MTVGQILAKLGVDNKEYEKGLKKAEAQADKAGLKIGNIFKNAFSVTLGMGMFEALKKGFKSTVGTAISFNSMLQTAQIGFATMLGSAERAQKFLEDMADFAARTPFEYPELLEAAKKMLAYGFAAENVLPTLRAVGDAAAALGAGSEGIDRITLALGQIQAKGKLSAEEMRQLTEAGVPAWHILAEAMGTTVPELQKMVSKGLIPGAKAVEMLTAGMTKRFGGMMASMEDTWQGVTSSIKDIWRMTVGTLTQSLFGGLNAILIKVRDFLSQFYSMLQAVMGKKAQRSTDALTDSIKDQAEAMVDLGDVTEDAAKQAKKNLQTFDEVHQLQEDMSDTAVWDNMFVMPETGTMAPPEMEDTGESETFTKMQEILEKLAVLFDPVIEGFNRLKTAAEPVIANIGEGLKWFYDNVLVPYGTWVISEAVPSFMNLLSGALNALNPILEAFKPLGQWLWENFLQPAGEWAGETLLNALNWLADVLTRIGNWMSEHKGIIEAIAIAVGSFAAAWGLVNLAIGIWNTIGVIATAVTTGFGAAVAFVTSPIFLVVAAIAAVIAITVLLVKNWDTVKEWLKETWNKIKDVAVSIWDSIKGFFSNLWEWLKNFFSEWGPIILAIIAPFIGIPLLIFQNWDKIKDFFSDLWEKISNQLSKAWQSIKDAAKKFWDDLVKSAFDWGKNLINNIIDGIKSMINKIKDAVSNVANKIKSFLGFSSPTEEGPGRDADKWAPNFVNMYRKGIKQGIPGISSSLTEIAEEMAGLATMTVQPAVQATASVGYTADSGRMSDGIAQAVYRAIIDAFRIIQASSGQNGNDDKEIVLKIDNTVLARMQLPALIREGQRQGLNLVVQPQGV